MMLGIFVEPETVRKLPSNYLSPLEEDVEVEDWGLKVRLNEQERVWIPWHRIVRVEER